MSVLIAPSRLVKVTKELLELAKKTASPFRVLESFDKTGKVAHYGSCDAMWIHKVDGIGPLEAQAPGQIAGVLLVEV